MSRDHDSDSDRPSDTDHGSGSLESELTAYLEGEEHRRQTIKRFSHSDEVKAHFEKAHGGNEQELFLRSGSGGSVGSRKDKGIDDLAEGEWRTVGEKKESPVFGGYQANKGGKDFAIYGGNDKKFGGYSSGRGNSEGASYGHGHSEEVICTCGDGFENKDGIITPKSIIPGEEDKTEKSKEGYLQKSKSGQGSYGTHSGGGGASYGSFSQAKSNIYK